MREWWRYHIEDRLDQLRINWDTVFLYAWILYAIKTLLSGGVDM